MDKKPSNVKNLPFINEYWHFLHKGITQNLIQIVSDIMKTSEQLRKIFEIITNNKKISKTYNSVPVIALELFRHNTESLY